jgi:hypothetical protein
MGAKKANFDLSARALNVAEEIYFRLGGTQQLQMRAFYEGVLHKSLQQDFDVVGALAQTLMGELPVNDAETDLNSVGLETLFHSVNGSHDNGLCGMVVLEDAEHRWEGKTKFDVVPRRYSARKYTDGGFLGQALKIRSVRGYEGQPIMVVPLLAETDLMVPHRSDVGDLYGSQAHTRLFAEPTRGKPVSTLAVPDRM